MLRFQPTRRLAQGRTAVVCRCMDSLVSRTYAMKIMMNKKAAMTEVCNLRSLGHPNVINAVYYFDDDEYAAIVMPLMSMNLSFFIDNGTYDLETAIDIMIQLARGIHHIHTRGMVHMDIKPENVGVNCIGQACRLRCRILDLGSAIYIESLRSGEMILATAGFCAPETRIGIISSSCDIFSLGVLYDTLLKRTALNVCIPYELVTLISAMTEVEYQNRLNSQVVLDRLGDQLGSVLVKGKFWNSIVSNLSDGDLDSFVVDSSHRVHKIVTLVCSNDVEDIENAFWLLQEEARREMYTRPSISVASVLVYFHPKMHLSKLACYFYSRAISFLSAVSGFELSDDMRFYVWRISAYAMCERAVIRVLARGCMTKLVAWCSEPDKRWGSRQQPFDVFIQRFVDMGEASMCFNEACQLAAALRV